jgi:hypothetical protein
MFMIAMVTLVVMLCATNPKVVHWYVMASAITDIPHWMSFFYVLGWERDQTVEELAHSALVPVARAGSDDGFQIGISEWSFWGGEVPVEWVGKAKAGVGRKEL